MYLILDMHAAPGGQGHDLNISDRDPSQPALWESQENQNKLTALWQKIAQRYKDETWVAAYDLINEPNWTFEEGKNKNGIEDVDNKPLRQLLEKLAKAVREVDKKHIVIIEGNGWGNNYNILILCLACLGLKTDGGHPRPRSLALLGWPRRCPNMLQQFLGEAFGEY